MVQLAKLSRLDLVPLVCQISGHALMKTLTCLCQAYLVEIANDICTVFGPEFPESWQQRVKLPL